MMVDFLMSSFSHFEENQLKVKAEERDILNPFTVTDLCHADLRHKKNIFVWLSMMPTC